MVASSLAQASNCMNDSTTPDDALTASLTSVCILESPQQPPQHTEQIKRLKPIVYDALGYLQLQRNAVAGALVSFANSEANGSRIGDGSREFKHAVALYASGHEAEALAKLNQAMVQRRRLEPGLRPDGHAVVRVPTTPCSTAGGVAPRPIGSSRPGSSTRCCRTCR